MKIFYDVDTQNDFMKADGALPVPNAEVIIPNLEKLTKYARQNKIPIIGSVDRHFGTEEYREREGELTKWGGPFPDHCMDETEGQKKIEVTAPLNPIFIENRNYADKELEGLLKREGEKIIEKQSYDIFTNPNISKVLAWVNEAVVYGVATDYCVKAASLGMRKIGVEVLLVIDAIKAVNVNPDDGKKALDEMANAGAKFVKTEEIVEK